MVLYPGDALRSSGNPRILVLRSSSDSLTEMAARKDGHFIAQIIQVVETAAYRRMLVRIQLERLSFVGEMIYLTVELIFHKTIIYYYIKIKVKSRLVGLKSIKSYVKVNRSNTRNIRQVYRKGRLLTEQTLNQF